MKHVVVSEVTGGNWRTGYVHWSWTKFKTAETLIVHNNAFGAGIIFFLILAHLYIKCE